MINVKKINKKKETIPINDFYRWVFHDLFTKLVSFWTFFIGFGDIINLNLNKSTTWQIDNLNNKRKYCFNHLEILNYYKNKMYRILHLVYFILILVLYIYVYIYYYPTRLYLRCGLFTFSAGV